MKVQLSDRTFWCTIGGGAEADETPELAARRELLEETGLQEPDVAWGPAIWYGEHMLDRNGVATLHKETFVLAHTFCETLSTSGLTDEERNVVREFRWWSLGDLKHTNEFIVPPRLSHYLELLLAGAIPHEPLDIELGDE
jgi:8-oxo-dGTP pyrophosphatase MutT (NUDIX family)